MLNDCKASERNIAMQVAIIPSLCLTFCLPWLHDTQPRMALNLMLPRTVESAIRHKVPIKIATVTILEILSTGGEMR